MNKLKKLLFTILVFNLQLAFSEKEALPAKTEASAVCLDQNCPSAETPLSSLKTVVDAQVCSSMKENPKCQGIDEHELEGCRPLINSLGKKIMVNGVEGVLQCGLGLGKGVSEVFISLYDLIKGIFSDDEDPGLKAYLHAELESKTQNDIIDDTIDVVGAVTGLLMESIKEEHSCLNNIASVKKACQFLSNFLVLAAPMTAAAALLPQGAGLSALLGLGVTATGGILTGVMHSENPVQLPKANLFVSSLATAAFTLIAPSSAIVSPALAGSAYMHDSRIRKRIKEKMKTRIEEFKELEKSKEKEKS